VTAFFPELVFLMYFMFLLEIPELVEQRGKMILLKEIDYPSGCEGFEIMNFFGQIKG
jgi:hypothetical protein